MFPSNTDLTLPAVINRRAVLIIVSLQATKLDQVILHSILQYVLIKNTYKNYIIIIFNVY